MSDIKKIRDEYINKLNQDLDLSHINQIKTELFGKNGKNKLGCIGSPSRRYP